MKIRALRVQVRFDDFLVFFFVAFFAVGFFAVLFTAGFFAADFAGVLRLLTGFFCHHLRDV